MPRLNLRVLACETRAHCRVCRGDSEDDAGWRERVVGVREFECPHGVTADNLPSRGLGDTIEKITKRAGIKPCGGCKKRRDKLNRAMPYKKDSP